MDSSPGDGKVGHCPLACAQVGCCWTKWGLEQTDRGAPPTQTPGDLWSLQNPHPSLKDLFLAALPRSTTRCRCGKESTGPVQDYWAKIAGRPPYARHCTPPWGFQMSKVQPLVPKYCTAWRGGGGSRRGWPWLWALGTCFLSLSLFSLNQGGGPSLPHSLLP